jgi:hypothetical protein
MTTKSAKAMYTEMESQREIYLNRARECAKLTLPMLVPPAGANESTVFDTPWQGLGARGVNNLAATLLMSLLPPNQPMFRLVIDEMATRPISDMAEIKTEIDQTLSAVERAVMQEIETTQIRPGAFEALKHLIVAGNILLYLPDEGGLRVYRMDSYVIKRDPLGNPRCIVTKESVSPYELPEEYAAYIEKKGESYENTVDIYTKIEWKRKRVHVHQEIGGKEVTETRGSYAQDKCPWLPLRMSRVDGEDWGRSYVEELIGDLRSLDGLHQAVVEASAAASKLVIVVNPNGSTRVRAIAKARSGDIIEGNPADVGVIQTNKGADLNTAMLTINSIKERLSYAFLLTEATIRNAERVTAEEVRLVIQSIERQLGGIYSVLSQEFQLPLVRRVMDRMKRTRRLPDIPEKYVKPTIITGIDALGRGNDLNKLDVFIGGISQVLGPEMLRQYVNIPEYLARRAASLGIDTKGLVVTEEEIAAKMQQQRQMQMQDQYGPELMGAIAKGVANNPQIASQMTRAATGAQPAQQ